MAVTHAALTELAAAINVSSQMDVNIAASGATVPVSNTGLTELAAAINASSQMDVNIAASGATLTVASHAVTNAGTFAVQASQSGTWTVQPGNTANTTPWLVAVDGTVTVGSHAVTNAGTFAVQVDGSALTALQLIDDVVFAEDTAAQAADKGVAILAVRRDADTSLVDTTNDYAPLQVDANGYLKVEIFDGGGSHTVDNAGTFAVQAAQSGTWNVGTVTTLTTITDAVAVTNAGLTELAAAINGSSQLDVNIAASGATLTVASHAVTNAGTFAVQAAGDVAHDTGDSGAPVKVGAKATSAITGITAVANNDRTQLYAGLDGVLITRENANLESLSRGTAAITDGSSTSVIAAAGAGIKTYITDVIISNSSATYVTVDIRDGTAGSVMATFPAPATSGCVHKLGSPIAGTANTAVAADPSAAASTVTITLLGFKSLL